MIRSQKKKNITISDRGTSCENIAPLVRLLLLDKGPEVVDEILTDSRLSTAYTKEFFKISNNWMQSEDWIVFKDLIKEAYGNPSPRLFFELGQRRYRVDKGVLIGLAKLLPVKKVLEYAPYFNRQMNEDQEIAVPIINNQDGYIINYYYQKFKDQETISECFWTQGILSGFPTLRYLPKADVKEILCSFDPVRVINNDYSYLGVKARKEGDKILIDDNVYFERAPINCKNIGKAYLLNSKETPLGISKDTKYLLGVGEEKSEHYGWHSVECLKLNDEIIFDKNEIWGSPYCLYHLAWKKLGFFEWMRNRPIHFITAFGLKEKYREAIKIANQWAQAERKARKKAENAEIKLRQYAGSLEDLVNEKSAEIIEWNKELEKRVDDQLKEIERINRLKRFLSPTY